VRLWILVLPIGIAAFGAMTAFGTTRYRAPAEPCLVVLAGIGVDAAVRRYERRRSGAAVGATSGGSGVAGTARTEDRALAGVGGHPAGAVATGGDDWRYAPPGAPVGRGAPGGPGDGWDDQRQRALWTGRAAPPPPPPDDEPYWVEQAGAWTDGYGNYTDGHQTWSDGRSQWAGAADGYGDPRARAQWDEHPTAGFAGGGGPADRDRSEPPPPPPSPEPATPQRPVRLPLVVATVIAVMLGVGAAGMWVTQVTGNAQPMAPNQMAPAPALPPR
jgi:hypothetical protein